jgi:hypothetical protein
MFVENAMQDAAGRARISEHIRECEFCSEFCETYKLYRDSVDSADILDLPQSALDAADDLYKRALRGMIVDMRPLAGDIDIPLRLAADGGKSFEPDIVNLATLCSEQPEAILRVMRDSSRGIDYVQLISDDPELSRSVMIRIPEIGWESLTDDEGKAIIEKQIGDDISNLKWQIKLPDAVFSMKPLEYDPDETRCSGETELTTADSDRIHIELQSKTEGKQIAIKVLELDGKKDFGDIRVVISQRGVTTTSSTSRDSTISFDLTDTESVVNIRIFQ